MFNKYSNKYKLIGLLVVLVILLLASKKRSFDPLLASYSQLQESKNKLKYIDASGPNLELLKSEIEGYNSLIGSISVLPSQIQQDIIHFVSKQDKVNLVKIEEIHEVEDDNFKIYTNRIILEADYYNLIKSLYEFEREFKISRVVSVGFEKKTQNRTREPKLYLTIIFQNYENTKP